MSGMAILFMLFFWMFITILSTFCLTLVFYTTDRKEQKVASTSDAGKD